MGSGVGAQPFHFSPAPPRVEIHKYLLNGSVQASISRVSPDSSRGPGVCPALLPCTACERLGKCSPAPKDSPKNFWSPEDLPYIRWEERGFRDAIKVRILRWELILDYLWALNAITEEQGWGACDTHRGAATWRRGRQVGRCLA